MPPFAFRQRIRRAIANPALQAALDANAARRLTGRARALASLPDYEARRQQAAAIRNAVRRDLDAHLDTFLAQAAANGLIVHRAADAAAARAIIAEIVGAAAPAGALVAKSKSMVSEEIGLNEALQDAGHRVVETDLGEYIVQLRGEKPSHIITPAVHLRRQEVAALFQQKLGIPYTEDVETLTAAARQTLRDVFLQADVGISGVNFGVVRSGGLCIVTNEGNGRMVTTLPRVHIALMGLERLVPDLDALALMLSLLPRSATGQKISVYTQLIHRPLPGQQRHLVVLDNGRRALAESPLAPALACIRCGACLNACPAFREIGGHAYGSVYPGPIGSVISPGLFGPDFQELAYACSLCGACAEVCPVQIPLPDLLVRVRAGQTPQPARPGAPLPTALRWGLRAYAWLGTHPRAFRAAQWLAGHLPGKGAFWRMPAWTGWGLGRDLPRPARLPFSMQTAAQRPAAAGRPPSASPPPAASPPETVSPSPSAPLDAFLSEWQALGGAFRRIPAADLTAALLAELRARSITRLQAWPEIPGVDFAALQAAGIALQAEPDPALPAGLSGALAAVAENGALLIPGGDPARPLTASLLPPLHIAVLPADAVLPRLEDALRLPEVQHAPAAVLVAGPSRTADIEMTLTIGVHGPKEVLLFVTD